MIALTLRIPFSASRWADIQHGNERTEKDRPELAEIAIPLTAHLPVIAARGGEDLVKRLFEPLGYTVETHGSQLDDKSPEWGASPYVALTITGTVRLQDLLTHLYVLIPVLDNEKHYWVANDEIEKLLKRGEGWLGAHPEKDLIVSRHLKRQRSLTREALSRLLAEDTPSDEGDEIPSVESPRWNARLPCMTNAYGRITFYANGSALSILSLSGGTVSVGINFLRPGANVITATYDGDSNFIPQSSINPVTVTVTAVAGFIHRRPRIAGDRRCWRSFGIHMRSVLST